MGVSVFLASREERTLFEIGGSWMCGFPEEAMLSAEALTAEVARRLPGCGREYVEWLAGQMWTTVVRADWNVRIVQEPAHDALLEQGYVRAGTYFPLRDTEEVL